MMGRWLLLVLLVVTAGAAYLYWSSTPPDESVAAPTTIQEKQVTPVQQLVLTDKERFRQEVLATLTFLPGQIYPAGLPWGPLHDIGVRGGVPLENLLHNRPLDFLEMCLERYEQEVQGYTLTFLKRERVAGKVYPPTGFEKVRVHFREHPFSVHMHWLENAKLAQTVLYVKGENNGKLLARPTGRLLGALVVSRDVDSADARESGRYTVAQFGLYQAMQRSVDAMKAAQKRGALHLSYQGVVTLAEVGERPCYKFVRTPYEPPEEDGVNELTLYIDRETWLQVGSVLKDFEGQLIGEYFFRDIELNPSFSEKQFQRGGV